MSNTTVGGVPGHMAEIVVVRDNILKFSGTCGRTGCILQNSRVTIQTGYMHNLKSCA